jgi:pimeloyl-ACP methyl ester carboxylesterase
LRRWVLAVAALAASAYSIRRCSRKVEADYPPLGRVIEVDGVRLHVVMRGAGTPLLLLHGNGSNVLDLELSGLIDRAAEHYQVIALDRPGFGYSTRPYDRPWTARAQAELVHKALRQFGIARPIVAAHSSGTQVALELALRYPHDVRSLVLMSGYYYPSPRADALLMSVPALPLFGALLRHTISPWLARLLWPLQARVLFSPAPVTSSFRAYPPWMSLRPTALRAAAAEYAQVIVTAAKLRGRYSRLKMPVVILSGADDRFIAPGWNSVRLHHEIAGSELTLVPGAGHMLHHSVPEEVMTAIDAAAAAPLEGASRSGVLHPA